MTMTEERLAEIRREHDEINRRLNEVISSTTDLLRRIKIEKESQDLQEVLDPTKKPTGKD